MSFLKKGKRAAAHKEIKQAENNLKEFTLRLNQMNYIYSHLIRDEEVTEENIENKIKDITDFKFTETELTMLKSDLCKS